MPVIRRRQLQQVAEQRRDLRLAKLRDEGGVDALVQLANERGGRDNITVVLVDIVDDGDKALEASALLSASTTTSTAPRTWTWRSGSWSRWRWQDTPLLRPICATKTSVVPPRDQTLNYLMIPMRFMIR